MTWEAWFTRLPILIHWSGLVFSTGTLVKKQDLFFLYSIKNVYELMEALHNFHHHQGNLVKYPSEDYTPSITSGSGVTFETIKTSKKWDTIQCCPFCPKVIKYLLSHVVNLLLSVRKLAWQGNGSDSRLSGPNCQSAVTRICIEKFPAKNYFSPLPFRDLSAH